ncbi:MAG: DegV family protein [Christensenellales bacterium]
MIYLVTDSTCYLTRREAADLHILVVPLRYDCGGRDSLLEGYAEDWRPEPGLDLSRCSTAQAPASAFQEVFRRLRAQGHQALCLTLSSRLSGTYLNALKAAQETAGQVLVLDSRTTGGALYLLAREARALLDQGLDLQACFDRLRLLRERTRTLFTLEDMGPLRRSGRLGAVRSSVSTLLNLRPVLTLQDGGVVSWALARGRQDQLRRLQEGLTGQPAQVVVQYCGDEAGAGLLAGRLRAAGVRVLERPFGIVLAIHLGLPVLSTAWLMAEGTPSA